MTEFAITYHPCEQETAERIAFNLNKNDLTATVVDPPVMENGRLDSLVDMFDQRRETLRRIGAGTLLVVTKALTVEQNRLYLPVQNELELSAAWMINKKHPGVYHTRHVRYLPERYGESADHIKRTGAKVMPAPQLQKLLNNEA